MSKVLLLLVFFALAQFPAVTGTWYCYAQTVSEQKEPVSDVGSIPGLPRPWAGGDVVSAFLRGCGMWPSKLSESGKRVSMKWGNGNHMVRYTGTGDWLVVELFRKDGSLFAQGGVKDNLAHGAWQWFGRQRVQCFYVRGTLTGYYMLMDDAIHINELTMYRNGKLHGRMWGWDRGSPVGYLDFRDDKLDGLVVHFSRNGRVVETERYIMNQYIETKHYPE